MNMKRFVYGDDDFLRCSMFVILTSDVTSVVVHVALIEDELSVF